MVNAIVDTSIVVDLLNNYPAAINWYIQQTGLAVTRITWLETLNGVHDSIEQGSVVSLLRDFELIELTVSDMDWATRQLMRLRLSHSLDAFDCLIAAPAFRLQLLLYTRNLKHFAPLLGALARQPY